jgi:hypothetical protein
MPRVREQVCQGLGLLCMMPRLRRSLFASFQCYLLARQPACLLDRLPGSALPCRCLATLPGYVATADATIAHTACGVCVCAAGLEGLELHHLLVNSWDLPGGVTAEQNVVLVSIASGEQAAASTAAALGAPECPVQASGCGAAWQRAVAVEGGDPSI